MTPVTLNCVCFRHKNLDDQANEELLRRLVESGFAFLGRAFVKGEFCMRACFINLRTEEEDIVAIINEVLRLGRLIKPAS